MSPGMCACRDTDPACPRVLGAPRERVCIFSVPGAVVMISPGVTATTSGVDPTDGVRSQRQGNEFFLLFFPPDPELTSHIWAAHAVSLSAVEQKAVLVGSARTTSWSTGLELHLRVTPR